VKVEKIRESGIIRAGEDEGSRDGITRYGEWRASGNGRGEGEGDAGRQSAER